MDFIAGVKVEISSKKFYTSIYFSEKSHDHIHDVIHRPYLPRGILNVSFQMTPCLETFKEYV